MPKHQVKQEVPPEEIEKEKPLPKKKKVKSFYAEKIVSVVVWLFIILLGVGSLNFLLKEIKVSNQLSSLKEEVKVQNKKIENVNKNTENSGNFDVFNRSFIMYFYNTTDEQQSYQDALKKYFPTDTTIPINDPSESNKKVLSIQLWEKKKKKGIYRVKYLIDYQINDKRKQELVCYSIKENQGKYVVLAIPYKQVPSKMTNNTLASAERLPETNKEQVATKEKEDIQSWLNDTFFPKYIETSDKAVVKYMMKDPEVLGGIVSYKDISQFAVYQKGDALDCYAVVVVKDPETQQEFNNHYHLVITKDSNNQYMIEKLEHNL